MKADQSTINLINTRNVINVIRKTEPIFRAEISRITGLSIPTVMKITDDLIAKKLVREVGKGESTGGKRPELLEFMHDSYNIIGVDIGTTNILVNRFDLSANVICEYICSTRVEEGWKNVIERVLALIDKALNHCCIGKSNVIGIGIGMPGLIDVDKGKVVFSPVFKWENVDVVEIVRDKFNLPVYMDNVTRTMANGEKWFGLGKDVNNFVCINLGYGIGAALVVNGEIYYGSSGSASEFGHMILEKEGPQCDCGNRGCLEALSSGNAIAKKAKRLVAEGHGKGILELAGSTDSIEARTVFEAAKAGDEEALQICDEAMNYLGVAIASIINFIDPELIILEGGIAKAGQFLIDRLQKVINQHQMKHAGKYTKIVVSKLGKRAASIGAASFILHYLIENGGDVPKLNNLA